MPENFQHRRARVVAIALIALDVELALVAERAVETRTVHAGGDAEIVQRGRGEAALAKEIERFTERDIRLIGARPAAPFRLILGSRWRRFAFLYHFARNSLTGFILCETV